LVVSDKGAISDATGAVSRWTEAGPPETLAADNGSAFKATDFTDSCNDLGITIERTIAGAPTMRGTIERLFRTCATSLLPRLSGRTFPSVVEKGDHQAEKRACLGPEDICSVLVRWIVDIYHNSPHAGLEGRTPREQWEADHRVGNYPLRAAPDLRAKRLAFGMTLTRKGDRDGVTILGVRYHSEDLARTIVKCGPRTFNIRWDAEDIGAVEVEIDGAWHEVPAVFEGFDGLHAQLWITARRDLRIRNSRQAQWAEDVVRDAVRAITALNTHRSLQFKLIEKPYSKDYVESLEDSLFASFSMTKPRPKTAPTADGYGETILPTSPDFETGIAPFESGEIGSAGSEPHDDDDWEFPQ
jgi:putative transposase